ncbi:MAG: DUF4339 domain-containing protein [Verrucomicrobia bacterium]|nr:DUF4339 domain-containing protein [Verrucomicrobiota bacterium]
MTEWYYACGGQQSGPVTFEQLGEIARSGGFDPMKDLVWTSTMKDWTPAGMVPGLFVAPAQALEVPPADPANPYAAPQSAWTEPPPSTGVALLEITPGSEPLDVGACVTRGFELTKRQFGTILLVGVVYFAVFFALAIVLGIIQGLVTAGSHRNMESIPSGIPSLESWVVSQVITLVFSMFIGLGITRIGLNLVSGKEVSVGMLFGEGGKLLRALGATILFGLMVCVGPLLLIVPGNYIALWTGYHLNPSITMLLIVPGIYVALRYGQYMIAIVDRDMGIMESLSYSSSITTNNRLKLFLLYLLSMAIVIAGMLACFVGLIFAGPVVWLMYLVAYRWMQYGSRATLDHPGTTTPLLAGV